MDGAQLCVATCYLFVQQKRSEEKVKGGARMSRCAHERVRSVRGAGCERAAALMVVGSAHAPLPGVEQNERERDEQQACDVDAMLCKIYWKIENWNE